MPVTETIGLEKLTGDFSRLDESFAGAQDRVAELLTQSVSASSPRKSGAMAAAWGAEQARFSSDGRVVEITTRSNPNVSYSGFVDRGTRYIEPRLFAQKAIEMAQPAFGAFFDNAADDTFARF